VRQKAAGEHGDEGVEDCEGEDADNGAVGGCEVAAEPGNFDEAGGEQGDGDDGGDELGGAQDALEPEVGDGVAEAVVCVLDAHGGWWGVEWIGVFLLRESRW